jgi:hypothetical protein
VDTMWVVLIAVAAVVTAVVIPLLLVHAVDVVLPDPPRRDDGVYGFFGVITEIGEGNRERPVPMHARFELRDDGFRWIPEKGSAETASFSSLAIAEAARSKRVWGTRGATREGLELRVSGGRTLRVRLDASEHRRTGGRNWLTQPSSMLAQWLEQALRQRNVPYLGLWH